MRFPAARGETLGGQAVEFPRDFAGGRTIAIVAFDLKQRAQCESWVPFIDRYARTGVVRGRLFAAVPNSMQLMKRMIVATMRQGAPTPEARDATIPLFVDLDAFCSGLQVRDRSRIQTLLIESDGLISAQHAGAFAEAAGNALAAKFGVRE